MKTFIKIISLFRRDASRILSFFSVVIVMTWISDWFPKLIGHPEFTPLFTSAYMIILLAAFSHMVRRILFHRLDLQSIGTEATKSPTGAAIVFFGICVVFSTIIFCFTIMLR